MHLPRTLGHPGTEGCDCFQATDKLEASSQYFRLEDTRFSQTGHWPRSQAIRAETGLMASTLSPFPLSFLLIQQVQARGEFVLEICGAQDKTQGSACAPQALLLVSFAFSP